MMHRIEMPHKMGTENEIGEQKKMIKNDFQI